MRDNLLYKWGLFSKVTKFFDQDRVAMGEEIGQEYDDLFKGTNASVYIPLWASVCKYENGSLMDGTTLKVVNRYQKWGYKPLIMDGNPPDFIGEQTRFLSYLCASALHELDKGGDVAAFVEEIENFSAEYLLDTVRVVAKGIIKHSKTPLFLEMVQTMYDMVTESEGKCDAALESLVCYENYKNGRECEIESGDEQIIMTGGRNNCGGKCSILATAKDGCVLNLETGCDIGSPTVKACVRGKGYRSTYFTGERLRYPMKRIGQRGEGRFKRISWEEAAKEIACEWVRIKEAYGVGSRYVNYGTGVSAVMRPDAMTRRLLNLDGGFLGFYGSYSSICTSFTTPFIYGDMFSGNSVESIASTKMLILWANNLTETIISPQFVKHILTAKQNGARVIVIDPRNSDTAISLADQWIPIKPTTDGALADAMAYTIWSEGLQDQHFMDTYCIGFDKDHMPEGVPVELNYKSYLFGEADGIVKDAKWAEGITGVPSDVIVALAREYATTKPAALLPGLGNQRISNGEQTVRGMAALTCMTGNIGMLGGGAAGMGASIEEPRPSFPFGTSAYPGVISVFLWSKAIEQGSSMTKKDDHIMGMDKLDSNIKMLFNLAGNVLINQHSDINATKELLKDTSKCEYIVSTDVFMTPSVKYADIVLPAPSFLEENNMSTPWSHGHYLIFNNKIIEPLFGCRTEFDWLSDVARNLGLWESWSEGRATQDQWLEHLYTELQKKNAELPSFDLFKEKGGYTYKNPKPYIAYEAQIKDPENNKFKTPSGKIEIFSKRLHDMGKADIPGLPSYLPGFEGPSDPLIEKYPLQLIGWHTKRRCHSIHDNNPWMEEIDPQRIWINPSDAAARGIKTGDVIEVFNDRGRIHMPAYVTDRIIAGVCSIAQGAWYTPDENGVDKRGSINVLTTLRPTPLARGNPQHTNLVEIKAL